MSVGSPGGSASGGATLAARPCPNPSRTLHGLPRPATDPRFGLMRSGITRVQVCGPLEVEVAGRVTGEELRRRQGGLVVAFLALNRARAVTRDELVELLWPSDPPGDPAEALAALLSKLRRTLGRDALEGRRELRLALAPDAVVDWEVAAERVRSAAAVGARGEWRAAWDEADAALDVAERGFLVGHAGGWVEERRRELEELRLAALEALARAGIALGEPEIA